MDIRLECYDMKLPNYVVGTQREGKIRTRYCLYLRYMRKKRSVSTAGLYEELIICFSGTRASQSIGIGSKAMEVQFLAAKGDFRIKYSTVSNKGCCSFALLRRLFLCDFFAMDTSYGVGWQT